MKLRNGLVLAATLLSACGPKMTATRYLERGLSLTNSDSSAFTINRIVVNGEDNNSSCNDYPSKSLSPGEAYTTTFLMCGNVKAIRIETDKGTVSSEFN